MFVSAGLSLSILDGHLGAVPDHLQLLVGTLLSLTAMVATAGAPIAWTSSFRGWCLGILTMALAVGCLFGPEPSARLLVPSLFLIAAFLVRKAPATSIEKAFLLGTGLYGLGAILLDVMPSAWTTVTQTTVELTKDMTGITGGKIGLGPSALPLGTAVYIGTVMLLGISGDPSFNGWKRVSVTLGLLILLLLGQVGAMGTLAASSTVSIPSAWTVDLVMSTVSTVLMLLIASYNLPRIGVVELSRRVVPLAFSALAFTLTVLLVATHASQRGSPQSGDILLLVPPPALDPLHDFRPIPDTPVPLHDVGLFGELPGILRTLGFSAITQTGLPTPEQLQHARLVCLAVPSATWAAEAENLVTLQQFVERGGSLLILAEHTNFQMSSSVLNTLLIPFGIKVNFDTTNAGFGEDLRGVRLWSSDYRTILQALLAFPYNRGASLTVKHPARPVLVGRWWQGDAGNSAADDQAFLGDFRVGPGDTFGDRILAAEWKGSNGGRVLVFGDTTPFVNAALGYTQPALVQIIQTLTTPAANLAWGLGIIAGLGLVGGIVLVSRSASASVAAFVLVSVGALSSLMGLVDAREPQQATISTPTLLVLANFQNQLDLSIYGDWAPTSLLVEARRQGLIPWVASLDQVSITSPPKVIVLAAPRRRLSKTEWDILKGWIEEGATMVLTVAGNVPPAAAVAAEVGLTVGPSPLGRISVELSDEAILQFHSAWPLVLGPDWTPMVQYRKLPVIAQRPLGRGRIVVIGDEGLAANISLSTETTVFPSNLRWWGRLFRESHAPR